MRRKTKRPSTFKNILKAGFVLFLAGNWLYVAIFLVCDTFEDSKDYYEKEARLINYFDEYYYEKQYDELHNYMHLYNSYDEKYDVYWEVLDTYVDSLECLKWRKISESQIEDAREMEQYYYDKVIESAKNCRFPQNQKYLNDFVESVQQKSKRFFFVFNIPPFENGTADNNNVTYDTKNIWNLFKEYKTQKGGKKYLEVIIYRDVFCGGFGVSRGDTKLTTSGTDTCQ